MNDAKIVELYWSRSEEAIKETQMKYGKYCQTISYNILGNTSDAEECVNDTYLKAWNTMPSNKPKRLAAKSAVCSKSLIKKSGMFSCADTGI